MTLCLNCQQELPEDVKFCQNCGTKKAEVDAEQSVAQDDDQIVVSEEQQQIPIEQNANMVRPAGKVNESNAMDQQQLRSTPKTKKVFTLNKYIVGALIGIAAVGAVLFIWNPGNEKMKFQNGDEMAQAEEPLQAVKEIHMAEDSYVLYLNRTEQLSFNTTPKEVDTRKLKWSSSTDDIKVNQSGFIYSAEPNAKGTITVSNADGSVKAESRVDVSTKDEAFYAALDYITNSKESGLEQLDYTKESFEVGRHRDEDYLKAVDDFTEINEEIETYKLKQKQFMNADTNNIVDVDIYSDEVTGDIRKIVAIEYLPDNDLDITDYYFMNGQVRFVFNRNENYYRPVSAKQDFVGNRYYYYNDTMLLWRNIEQPSDKFNKTDYKFNKGEFDWTTFEYGDIEEDDVNKEKRAYKKPADDAAYKKEQAAVFHEHEQRMLDSAYNIYRQVTASPDTIQLTGYVLDPMTEPMEDVTVEVFSEQYDLLVGEAKVDEEGMYSVQVPMHYGDYTLSVEESGYVDTKIYGIDSNQNVASMMQESIYMYEQSGDMHTVYVDLIDAMSGTNFYSEDSSLVGLIIRRGINNKIGDVAERFAIDMMDPQPIELGPGNYTAEVQIPGYESNFFTISTMDNDMTVQSNIVPTIEAGEVNIVLTWGSQPTDLDSHLFYPNGDHIAYYSTEAQNGQLDVDETDGYGPETITLKNLSSDTYKYYVADFTNLALDNYDSYELSNSFARIDVYTKNDTQSFIIPRNNSAVIWQVFNITNGKIVPVQRLYNNVEDKEWWSASK